MANNKKVIVTGFEPFGEHAVNSSWVAVQELERLGLGEAVDLYVCEVPVEYQAVQSLLPSLWERHLPQLVVHVGVSGLATTVTLEQCGHNKGYKRPDNCRFCPASQCCMEDGPDCISSLLDMDTVCERVNNSDVGVAVSVSKDAGRYLCDYTYYSSLFLGHGRCAFIHVPPLGKPYSSQELGRALQAVVREMLTLLEAAKAEEEHSH
ncbi:pyroglutamyl-peptidase 1 isoform X1 [Syngnathoides biaculeatus]|uniref:pyroglutamyl-peptidase 1 isoform X1 n=1 Tax=Syngnathoides biaculeatus TaxID=300417 RepID=UPI002ADD58C4|nr:pyroglutamyl-peptidase 1 isoform X1 [Syngnathoides biaculeatus]XP_061695814.1 pyroglutamyl-peptidase 1 isoform X1 [Syngnathoides biaculeatus]XP_061695815.1 pyroglutamyl-peptidase 1 isoform X1 [Syngnathoides biaculeatus]